MFIFVFSDIFLKTGNLTFNKAMSNKSKFHHDEVYKPLHVDETVYLEDDESTPEEKEKAHLLT